MKYTLYKNEKTIMQRKRCYPLQMYLKQVLKMKSIYDIEPKEIFEEAKKNNYRIEVKKWNLKRYK